MKHKHYRILALLLALLLVAGTVLVARMVSVRATEETPAEQPTEAPTDPPTQAPTEPPTAPPTEPPTDPPTAPPTEPPTEAPTDPPTEAPTDPPTDAPTDAPTDPSTDVPTDPSTDAPTDPSTDAPTDAPTDPSTDAPTEHTHSYAETGRKDATCTEDGQITYTCSGCGESYTETIPAKGHSFGDWEVVKEASYETTGLKKRKCSVCGHEEEETIPATGYPEGSIVNVVFTVTGGKFRDGSTQKSVTVILWTADGKASPNGVGHITQAQIPTDMIPDEGYDNGFWGEPQPSPSVDIKQNTTFAYSYTGNFNYDGTYTSYNGPWRPTTPQPTQPTQPRPTQPTQTAAPTESETTEEESTAPSEDDFIITGGEAGAFGELIQMNGENLLIYRLPKGSFTVTNEGSEVASLSIFSNKTVTDADGKEAPAENFANYVITKDAEPVTVLMDADRYAVLNDGAVLHFVAEEEQESGTETVEPTTESLTETEATTDSASESAEASETDPAGQDPAGRPKMVLWPFILILSVLVIGLGVLIFFIIKLMKKSDGDEDAAENKRKKDQ